MPLVPITALPAAPSRLDEPATFVTKADAFVGALGTFVTQTNDLAEYLNGLSEGTLDGNLAAIAGVTSAPDTIFYFTGAETGALADFTAFGRSLVANANAAEARSDLGLGTAATIDIDTDTTLAANSDTKIATQKAVKAYVDANAGGASTTQPNEMIAGFIASPSDKSYTIALKMAHGGTITETVTKSVSGTCTATFKINTTALGGTVNSVSSTEQSQAHSTSNTFVAGDDIVLTVSSNSSCADMSFSIKYTRTLA